MDHEPVHFVPGMQGVKVLAKRDQCSQAPEKICFVHVPSEICTAVFHASESILVMELDNSLPGGRVLRPVLLRWVCTYPGT